ncbi:hypothetical protein A9Q98_13025 [Thalassotalea sp. 42_200_T64]|nr:hypothetical protein A9Q98_13025 [Thalassotalea sp. 42_200_T64]
MKLNYLMPLTLLAATTAFNTTAEDNVKYVFKAMDKSLNTRICVASANNDLPKLKQLSRRDQLGIRNITMNLICNNKDVTSFAAQYDAPQTTKYLGYVPAKCC